MAIGNSIELQSKQSIVSIGKYIDVTMVDSVIINTSGTATGFILKFQASLDNINYFDIAGTKLLDGMTSAATTSTLGEAWEFDVPALATFRTNLTAISSGYITVLANVPR